MTQSHKDISSYRHVAMTPFRRALDPLQFVYHTRIGEYYAFIYLLHCAYCHSLKPEQMLMCRTNTYNYVL